MNTETDLAKYTSKFLSEYLPYERNMSTNTIASYRDTFVLLIKFMKQEMNIEVQHLHLRDINKTSIVDFIQWLKVKRECSIATCNNRLNAIHSFAKFLQYEDIAHMDNWQKILTIKLSKSDTKSLNYLTTEGVKLLLEQPNLEYSSGQRDLAIMALLYDTGARVQELVDPIVHIENLEEERAIVVRGIITCVDIHI